MTIHCKYDELVPTKQLRYHPKNRNLHPPDQIKRLAKILDYQGWRYPVKVSKLSGFVTSGHGRIMAANLLAWDKVPVNFQEYESEEMEYADVQADNAIASWAELDLSAVNTDIGDLGPNFDLDMLGIKDFTLDVGDRFADKDEDAIPDVTKAVTQPGDLWQLGEHRVLCGDCTVKENVDRLMDGEKADIVFTDPPYMFGYDPIKMKPTLGPDGKPRNVNTHKPMINDSGEWDYKPGFILEYFQYCDEIFLWGADYFCTELPKKGSWICWNKIGDNDNFDRIPGASFELCWSKSLHKRHLISITWRGIYGHNQVLDGKRKLHPTQKPVKLAEWFFEKWGKDVKKVWDGYLGSGSTLIACEKTNRKCYGMEIDPHYCDVIVKRWETFTDKKAELISNACPK